MASVAPRDASPRVHRTSGRKSSRPAVPRRVVRAWAVRASDAEARRSDALGAATGRAPDTRRIGAVVAEPRASSSVRVGSSATASSPAAPPGGPGSPEWRACSSLLASAGLAPAETCDRAVSLAFGWEAKDMYWMGRRKRVPASPAVVEAALAVLSGELGLSSEDVSALLEAFPHVIGLPLDLLLRNARRLEGELPPARGGEAEGKRRLAKALVARPEVLGVLIDCEGDCKGLCTRCYCQV